MVDALSALEQISVAVNDLTTLVSRTRGQFVDPGKVQPAARAIASPYYASVHAELTAAQHRAGLCDDIEFVIAAILRLTSAPRKKTAYRRQITELSPYIQEAVIDVMKARGNQLVLSRTEREILDTLARMLPATAKSYEQVLRDIVEARRVSWRGTGSELREVLREVMDHLAPDAKVTVAVGFQYEAGRTAPTQKQKVRFILKARRAGSAAIAVAEGTLETVEESVASLARSTYNRGSASTHGTTDGAEVRKLKRYIDALLAELLEIAA
jgi:hypothetical protein